jgi:hypothetical protein
MINCNVCNSNNIEVKTVQGRGLPPKDYVSRPGKKISWIGNWEIFKCQQCGNEYKKLLK